MTTLEEKIWVNSFYPRISSPVFYFCNAELAEKITKTANNIMSQLEEKYKK